MSHIIFSHGDKGGTGKSSASSTLADYLMTKGYDVGVIDGDKAVRDVGKRFKNHLPVAGVNLNRSDSAEAVAIALMETIDQLDTEYVVINSPAAAGETLDQIGEVIVTVAQAQGHTVQVLYSAGATQDATQGIGSSLDRGLMHHVGTAQCAIVFNLFQCPRERFSIVRDGYLAKLGLTEIQLPSIEPAELAQKVMSARTPFSELAENGGDVLTLTERVLFQKKYVQPSFDALDDFFDTTAPAKAVSND